MKIDIVNFQTPKHICEYMASMVDKDSSILEPTKGNGNLVLELNKVGHVYAPDGDFLLQDHNAFYDYVVMNPPFTPMPLAYQILYITMGMTDNIIALMPYLTLINSDKRTRDILNFGLKSITHLPRTAFKGSRVQTCILEMKRGYKGQAIFKTL